jgi:large subunit ribosomal protein L22
MELNTITKYIRIAPRKLRLVTDLVRGAKVNDAVNTVKFTPKKGAKILYKSLMSAISNAEQKGTLDIDNLFIKKIYVNEGPAMKRYLPRAQGRATLIKKKSSHLVITLAER